MRRARERVADWLDATACRLFQAAHDLRLVYDGPLCPDCQLGPDLGEKEQCPVCREQWEAQQHETRLYDDGYVDGYSEARQRAEEF